MRARGRNRNRHAQAGFTLLELMISMTMLTVVLAMLYAAAWAMMKTARMEDSLAMLNAEARQAMTAITRNLRQARSVSLQTNNAGAFSPLGVAPVTNLQFARVEDVDGNGVALNAAMALESRTFWITADTADANGDGLTNSQLVRRNAGGQVVEVLANHLSPPVVTGDMYSAPQGGVLFQNIGGGNIQVTLILRHRADVSMPMMVVRLDEVVSPRN